jgi:hypothetical protein
LAPRTFGNRFLSEFRRLGGSTKGWPELAVTRLNEADRRQFVDALAKASSATSKELVIAAHTAEPEKLAERAIALDKRKARGGADAAMLSILGTLAAGSS